MCAVVRSVPYAAQCLRTQANIELEMTCLQFYDIILYSKQEWWRHLDTPMNVAHGSQESYVKCCIDTAIIRCLLHSWSWWCSYGFGRFPGNNESWDRFMAVVVLGRAMLCWCSLLATDISRPSKLRRLPVNRGRAFSGSRGPHAPDVRHKCCSSCWLK